MMRLPGWYTSLLSIRTESRGAPTASRLVRSICIMDRVVLDAATSFLATAASRVRYVTDPCVGSGHEKKSKLSKKLDPE